MGKIFNFRRPRQTGHREASNEEYISQIPHSSAAVGWGTVDHTEPDAWGNYQQGFRQNAEAFLNTTHPDMYNGRYMEREIDCHKRLAITEARRGRERNIRSIHNIRIHQKACLLELELAIARLEEAITRCDEEVAKC